MRAHAQEERLLTVEPIVLPTTTTTTTTTDDDTPLRLCWREVDCFVAGEPLPLRCSWLPRPWVRPCAPKQVLHGCWGEALPGELLAVMGPSGAGKTTLLNLLADRPTLGEQGSWSGKITLNGRPRPAHWKRSAAYVMQKDIFFERLTVHDHLRCTAMLRLPSGWSEETKLAELARVVKLLRLDGCLRTVVGSHTVRGLSGGELKRLNIATELLSRPRLLFLDEPLTVRINNSGSGR